MAKREFHSTPDISDLLINSDNADHDHERVQDAAENELTAILQSLSSLGNILWVAHSHHEDVRSPEVDRDDTAKIGLLMQRLADYAERFAVIAANAALRKHNHAAQSASS